MAIGYDYPTDVELTAVAQEYGPTQLENREIFKYFPIRERDSYYLEWEQEDNYLGLQQARGLDGKPGRVRATGAKSYMVEPGVYGEYEVIGERELLTRRAYGQLSGRIPLTDLVAMKMRKLMQRMYDRMEQILWKTCQGSYSVSAPNGAVVTTDAFNTRSIVAATPWATTGTATPLADFRSLKYLQRGYAVNFGPTARAYANSTTINALLANTNPNDLGGRRTNGLSSFNSLEQVNQLLMMDGLPVLVEYDQGYYDDASGTFQLFVPDHTVVVFGQRPAGQTVGEYDLVANAVNPDMKPGYYAFTRDNTGTKDADVPPSVEVHCGHNGGPVLFFGSAIVVMTV